MQNKLKHLGELSSLKLHLNYKKNNIIELKTISETIIAKINGYSYDQGMLFKNLFLKLNFPVEDIDSQKFNFFKIDINESNKFLEANNINYYINYLADINNNISFIEFKKIN